MTPNTSTCGHSNSFHVHILVIFIGVVDILGEAKRGKAVDEEVVLSVVGGVPFLSLGKLHKLRVCGGRVNVLYKQVHFTHSLLANGIPPPHTHTYTCMFTFHTHYSHPHTFTLGTITDTHSTHTRVLVWTVWEAWACAKVPIAAAELTAAIGRLW